MARQYDASRADFYRDAGSYEWALPMMVVMGLGTGAMMAHVHAVSDIPYGMLHGPDVTGHADGLLEGSFELDFIGG